MQEFTNILQAWANEILVWVCIKLCINTHLIEEVLMAPGGLCSSERKQHSPGTNSAAWLFNMVLGVFRWERDSLAQRINVLSLFSLVGCMIFSNRKKTLWLVISFLLDTFPLSDDLKRYHSIHTVIHFPELINSPDTPLMYFHLKHCLDSNMCSGLTWTPLLVEQKLLALAQLAPERMGLNMALCCIC